jgi:DNA replication protein DnaC
MPSYQKLINGLNDLGIQKMQEHLDSYIELVNKGEMSFTTALEELVEIEKKNNQIRRENANVHTANFPFIKTMEDFDFSFQPGINKKELLELNSLSFLDKKENILFVGSSGVGKTHLATAIGISCAKARNITYFITFENLMHQLKAAHHENRLESRLKFFAKYKVLIIDEIGYMPIDLDSANLFFQLIARRYEKNSTIITTNTPFSKWGEILGSVTLANAVLDRLLHHSEVISIKGPSYRLKDKRALLEVQGAEE